MGTRGNLNTDKLANEAAGSDARSGGVVGRATDSEVWVDGLTVLAVSVAICVAADMLWLMTVLVPLAFILRMLAWRRWAGSAHGIGVELAFLGLCTVLGGFNDWNSVVAHNIYDYTVPHYFPAFSSIPIWMLLFWGLILRLMATIATWWRIAPAGGPANHLHLGSRRLERPWLRVLGLLLLIAVTRQVIYRTYLDPIWSWVPFAVGILAFVLVFRPDSKAWKLGAAVLLIGPVVEWAYISVGGLHQYHHGWIGGVPLWIALWWVLSLWIWQDFATRIIRGLAKVRLPHAPQNRRTDPALTS